MKKMLLIFIILLGVVSNCEAELTKESLDSVAKFLYLDFYSLSNSNDFKLITDSFLVKETGDSVVLSKDEINNTQGVIGILSHGEYRKILIINEIDKIGMIVRFAYIKNNQLFWEDNTQSLLNFQLRPELGNTGVARLLNYDIDTILSFIKGSKKCRLPKDWQPTKKELDFYLRSIDAIGQVLFNRP